MPITEMVIRVFAAVAVGGVIGYERQKTNRPAGFRTHILVCVGAAVISIIQMESIRITTELIKENPLLVNTMKADVGRMGAQVITGVGFLGAGTIIRDRGLVKGLTTAASLWVVACIGLGIGLGLYKLTAVAFVAVFLSLVILKKVEERFSNAVNSFNLELSYLADEEKKVRRELERLINFHNIDVSHAEVIHLEEEGQVRIHYTLDVPKGTDRKQLVHELFRTRGVLEINMVEAEK